MPEIKYSGVLNFELLFMPKGEPEQLFKYYSWAYITRKYIMGPSYYDWAFLFMARCFGARINGSTGNPV
jgi:hypothetical protein